MAQQSTEFISITAPNGKPVYVNLALVEQVLILGENNCQIQFSSGRTQPVKDAREIRALIDRLLASESTPSDRG